MMIMTQTNIQCEGKIKLKCRCYTIDKYLCESVYEKIMIWMHVNEWKHAEQQPLLYLCRPKVLE